LAKHARATSGDEGEPYGLQFKPQETSFGEIISELPVLSRARQFQSGGSVRYPTSMDEFSTSPPTRQTSSPSTRQGRGRASFSANL